MPAGVDRCCGWIPVHILWLPVQSDDRVWIQHDTRNVLHRNLSLRHTVSWILSGYDRTIRRSDGVWTPVAREHDTNSGSGSDQVQKIRCQPVCPTGGWLSERKRQVNSGGPWEVYCRGSRILYQQHFGDKKDHTGKQHTSGRSQYHLFLKTGEYQETGQTLTGDGHEIQDRRYPTKRRASQNVHFLYLHCIYRCRLLFNQRLFIYLRQSPYQQHDRGCIGGPATNNRPPETWGKPFPEFSHTLFQHQGIQSGPASTWRSGQGKEGEDPKTD